MESIIGVGKGNRGRSLREIGENTGNMRENWESGDCLRLFVLQIA